MVKVGKNEAGQRGIPFLSEQKAWFQSDHFWDFVAVIDFPGLFGNRHTFTQALSTFSHFVVSFSALKGPCLGWHSSLKFEKHSQCGMSGEGQELDRLVHGKVHMSHVTISLEFSKSKLHHMLQLTISH